MVHRGFPLIAVLGLMLSGCDHKSTRPSNDTLIQNAIRDCPHASEFEQLFPAADYRIRPSKRKTESKWMTVSELDAEAGLYQRYTISFRVAIKIAPDGTVTETEEPSFYLGEN